MLSFDKSVLAPLFKSERRSVEVRSVLKGQAPRRATISHWMRVEFASLVAEDVRIGDLAPAQAVAADDAFEAFIERTCTVISMSDRDFDLARRPLSNHRSGLRAGDALHLAIASSNSARGVHSPDKVMTAAGQSLGLPMDVGFPATI